MKHTLIAYNLFCCAVLRTLYRGSSQTLSNPGFCTPRLPLASSTLALGRGEQLVQFMSLFPSQSCLLKDIDQAELLRYQHCHVIIVGCLKYKGKDQKILIT